MTVKLTLLVSVVTQFASNNSALRNFWWGGCIRPAPSSNSLWGRWVCVCANEIVFKTKRKEGGKSFFQSLSVSAGTQDLIWLIKSQTADDIYPAKCWWLRRKRLYPAFFLWSFCTRGSTRKSAQKELPVCEQPEPNSSVVAIALDDSNYIVSPLPPPFPFLNLACWKPYSDLPASDGQLPPGHMPAAHN